MGASARALPVTLRKPAAALTVTTAVAHRCVEICSTITSLLRSVSDS